MLNAPPKMPLTKPSGKAHQRGIGPSRNPCSNGSIKAKKHITPPKQRSNVSDRPQLKSDTPIGAPTTTPAIKPAESRHAKCFRLDHNVPQQTGMLIAATVAADSLKSIHSGSNAIATMPNPNPVRPCIRPANVSTVRM